jgi:hypothetical protein
MTLLLARIIGAFSAQLPKKARPGLDPAWVRFSVENAPER